MDAADRAQALQQAEIDAALERQRRRDVVLPATGRCAFCEEPLAERRQRFCDPDCHDDWQRLQSRLENDRVVRGLA